MPQDCCSFSREFKQQIVDLIKNKNKKRKLSENITFALLHSIAVSLGCHSPIGYRLSFIKKLFDFMLTYNSVALTKIATAAFGASTQRNRLQPDNPEGNFGLSFNLQSDYFKSTEL